MRNPDFRHFPASSNLAVIQKEDEIPECWDINYVRLEMKLNSTLTQYLSY